MWLGCTGQVWGKGFPELPQHPREGLGKCTRAGDEDEPQTILRQGSTPPRTGQHGVREHISFLKQKGYVQGALNAQHTVGAQQMRKELKSIYITFSASALAPPTPAPPQRPRAGGREGGGAAYPRVGDARPGVLEGREQPHSQVAGHVQ